MVRPKERYRHGARRRPPQLEPVYAVTEGFDAYSAPSDVGANRRVEVYRGSTGKVAEFYPWQLGTPPVVPDSDPGMVSSMVAWVLSNNSSNISYVINISSWTPTFYSTVSRGFEYLLNGTLYCTMVRVKLCISTAFVSYTGTYTVSVPPVNGQLSQTGVSASYDVLTVAVNLETGQVTQTNSALYSSSFAPTNFVAGNTPTSGWNYEKITSYTGYKEAVAASLPSSHPFKACGIQAWPLLSNRNGVPGTYSDTITNFSLPTLSNALLPINDLRGPSVVHPAVFSSSAQPANAQSQLFNLKGYDSEVLQRIYGDLGYLEWSELVTTSNDPTLGWAGCDGLAALGASVATTWGEYSPSNLTPREELLSVDGLPADDQSLLLEDPQSQPLASLPQNGSNAYSTTNPVYFRESPNWPSFAGSSLVRSLSRFYLIAN